MNRDGIDFARFAVLKTGHGVQFLTPKQWALFCALHARRGEIVGDARLIATVWFGFVPHDGQTQALRVLAHQLRGVLAGSRWSIVRHRSRGYEMVRLATPRQQPRGQQAENGLDAR
jgi:DNA-binding response OmpR family regulator